MDEKQLKKIFNTVFWKMKLQFGKKFSDAKIKNIIIEEYQIILFEEFEKLSSKIKIKHCYETN